MELPLIYDSGFCINNSNLSKQLSKFKSTDTSTLLQIVSTELNQTNMISTILIKSTHQLIHKHQKHRLCSKPVFGRDISLQQACETVPGRIRTATQSVTSLPQQPAKTSCRRATHTLKLWVYYKGLTAQNYRMHLNKEHRSSSQGSLIKLACTSIGAKRINICFKFRSLYAC